MAGLERRHVLIIEDDPAIRTGLVDALHAAGYATAEAGDGDAGLDLAVTYRCDLLLLDLVLPGRDGLDILREVRASRPTLPVIVLTARGDESDRIDGLRLGADDYVVKPFSLNELLARVAAVLRRSPERPTDLTEVPITGGCADLARRQVRFHDGRCCELSPREAELLRYLACNAGRVISREEVLSRVWMIDPTNLDTRTVDMTVARLREKLHDDATRPRLATVRGVGYRFEPHE